MNEYLHKPRFKTLISTLYNSCSMEKLMAANDYLYYIFNEQGSSYEAPLRMSSLVEKVGRDNTVLLSINDLSSTKRKLQFFCLVNWWYSFTFSSSEREALLLFHVRRSVPLHLVYVSLCKVLVTTIWLYVVWL